MIKLTPKKICGLTEEPCIEHTDCATCMVKENTGHCAEGFNCNECSHLYAKDGGCSGCIQSECEDWNEGKTA